MRLAQGSSSVCGAACRGGFAARPAAAARAKVLLPASPLSTTTTHASSLSPASTSSRRPLVAASASPGEGLAQATSPIEYPLTGAPREFDQEGDGRAGRRRRTRDGDGDASRFSPSRAEFFCIFFFRPRPRPERLSLFLFLSTHKKNSPRGGPPNQAPAQLPQAPVRELGGRVRGIKD